MEAGRYEILSVLGKGGCGTVYRARFLGEEGFQKEVALKVLHIEQDDEMARRLRDEARVLALMHHRAIVKVDRLIRLDGRWTVVMELVRGVDLRRLIEAGTVPLGPALEIVAEVAGALHVAWTMPGPDGRPLRLIHRDIKPSNLQLTAFGEVKVLDFGIARAEFASREAETEALAFGSLDYMSPERLDFFEGVPGPEGDVYALGLLLYELLTGKVYGRTNPILARHEAKLVSNLALLSDKLGDAGAPVVELVGRLLSFEPEARPEARELERLARQLRARLDPEGSLRDFSERVVEGLVSEVAPVQDVEVGRILEERTTGRHGGFGTIHGQMTSGMTHAIAGDEEATDLLVLGRDLHLPGVDDETSPLSQEHEEAVYDAASHAPAAAATPQHAHASAKPAASRSLVALFAVGVVVALLIGVGGMALFMVRVAGQQQADETSTSASKPADKPVLQDKTPVKPADKPADKPVVADKPADKPVVADKPADKSGDKPAVTTAHSASTPPKPTGTDNPTTTTGTAETPMDPPAATTGTGDGYVTVGGDVEYATVEGPAGFFHIPGPVPPGDYLIQAAFSDAGPVSAGTLTVGAGERVRLNCKAVGPRCAR